MATTYDKASLVMIPSGYKDDKLYSIKPTDGSGDFTFSRDGAGASPATRVNASGLIEKGRTNELLQSNTFDTTWSTTRASFIGGQSGYDGTNDAWAMVDDANNSTHLSAQSLTIGASVATFSIYAKAGDVDFLAVRFEGSSVDYAYFNLGSGTLGTIDSDYIEARITSVGGGWYRCEATRVLAASGNQVVILSAQANNDPTYAGAGTTAIYIQDAQVELGLVATDVIETTTAPVSAGLLGDMPRLDYSGGATCPSLLLEPSRVNAVSNSEYIDALAKTGMTITSNATTSPEGVVNASKIAYTSSTSYIAGGTGLTTGVDHTFTAFLKPDETNYVIVNQGGASATNATYNFADGTHSGGTGITTDMIDYGNGWYRIVYTANLTFNSVRMYMSGNGSYGNYPAAGEGFFAWGFQLEASASYPTSYIPTYGSASTRGVDKFISGNISSLIGNSEFVLFAELSSNNDSANYNQFGISDGTTDNMVYFNKRLTDNTIGFVYENNNVTQLREVSVSDISSNNKLALRYTNGVLSSFANGTKAADVTGLSDISATLTQLQIGRGDYTSSYFEGKFKQLIIFPTALTDAECIALTTI